MRNFTTVIKRKALKLFLFSIYYIVAVGHGHQKENTEVAEHMNEQCICTISVQSAS